MSVINRGLTELYNSGVIETAKKVYLFVKRRIRLSKLEAKIFSHNNIEGRFTEIYKLNYWEDSESKSGEGSSLKYTENLRRELPCLFNKFSINRIFDAPCGDFNWFKHIPLNENQSYIGGDIVLPLIENNNINYQSDNIEFVHVDITKSKYPKADIMICRDCLFHLSYLDIKLVLINFVNSGIPFLLTTTHIGGGRNSNITTGQVRFIDLFSEPFNFPKDVLYRIEDFVSPFHPREMCLWNREQIVASLANLHV